MWKSEKPIFMGFPRERFWAGFLTPLPSRCDGTTISSGRRPGKKNDAVRKRSSGRLIHDLLEADFWGVYWLSRHDEGETEEQCFVKSAGIPRELRTGAA
jgi:hypothetical protein